MNNRLKKIIFKKLYEDLSNVEIIPYGNSIFFIDREKKKWYFEYEKPSILWWRYDFFSDFFYIFSIERNEYEPIISEWVEEVLNCKVDTVWSCLFYCQYVVEEVLNCKVDTVLQRSFVSHYKVEDVLNYKVNTTCYTGRWISRELVENVLNYKVNRVQPLNRTYESAIIEVLLR